MPPKAAALHVSPPRCEEVEFVFKKRPMPTEKGVKPTKPAGAKSNLASENKLLVIENDRLREVVKDLNAKLERLHPLKDQRFAMTPKNVLNHAGLHQVHNNDVLIFLPTLINAYESETGKSVIRREGMVDCFPAEDTARVAEIALRLAPEFLPKYCKKN